MLFFDNKCDAQIIIASVKRKQFACQSTLRRATNYFLWFKTFRRFVAISNLHHESFNVFTMLKTEKAPRHCVSVCGKIYWKIPCIMGEATNVCDEKHSWNKIREKSFRRSWILLAQRKLRGWTLQITLLSKLNLELFVSLVINWLLMRFVWISQLEKARIDWRLWKAVTLTFSEKSIKMWP